MTVNVRFSGDPCEIDAVLAVLRAVVDVIDGGRDYPNRGDDITVRRYADVRLREPSPVAATAERVDRRTLPKRGSS